MLRDVPLQFVHESCGPELVRTYEKKELKMNYRSIPICPQESEVKNHHQMPPLRKNIVKGRYDGNDHYLDIQFRLLREDFIRSLRDCIIGYIRTKNEPKADKKLKNDKEQNVYRNVRVTNGSNCEFDCTPFRNIDWKVIYLL